MTRQPRSLLLAGRLKVREDRLTDYVAICAERNLAFAHGLLDLAAIDARPARVEAKTQTWTPRGRRVDLELVGFDSERREVCRLWAEHKTGADYQPRQLEDYAEDVALWSNSALLTIVERPSQAYAGRWEVATWGDVAAIAVGLLRRHDGRDWRQAAWNPHARAEHLVLAELLKYLDKEHGTVSDPLTTTDLVAIQHWPRAWRVLESLLERAAQLSGQPVADGVGWSSEEDAAWVVLDDPGAWWSEYGGSGEIHAASADTYFGASRRGEPAIGLGANIAAEYGGTLYATHPEWVAQLRESGFDPYRDDDWVRLYRTTYLAEVLAAGVTLEQQADFIARRLNDALRDLAVLAPPSLLQRPPSRGRRSDAKPSELPVAADEPSSFLE